MKKILAVVFATTVMTGMYGCEGEKVMLNQAQFNFFCKIYRLAQTHLLKDPTKTTLTGLLMQAGNEFNNFSKDGNIKFCKNTKVDRSLLIQLSESVHGDVCSIFRKDLEKCSNDFNVNTFLSAIFAIPSDEEDNKKSNEQLETDMETLQGINKNNSLDPIKRVAAALLSLGELMNSEVDSDQEIQSKVNSFVTEVDLDQEIQSMVNRFLTKMVPQGLDHVNSYDSEKIEIMYRFENYIKSCFQEGEQTFPGIRKFAEAKDTYQRIFDERHDHVFHQKRRNIVHKRLFEKFNELVKNLHNINIIIINELSKSLRRAINKVPKKSILSFFPSLWSMSFELLVDEGKIRELKENLLDDSKKEGLITRWSSSAEKFSTELDEKANEKAHKPFFKNTVSLLETITGIWKSLKNIDKINGNRYQQSDEYKTLRKLYMGIYSFRKVMEFEYAMLSGKKLSSAQNIPVARRKKLCRDYLYRKKSFISYKTIVKFTAVTAVLLFLFRHWCHHGWPNFGSSSSV